METITDNRTDDGDNVGLISLMKLVLAQRDCLGMAIKRVCCCCSMIVIE